MASKKSHSLVCAFNPNDDNDHEQVSIFDICIFFLSHRSRCDLYVFTYVWAHTYTHTQSHNYSGGVGKSMAGADFILSNISDKLVERFSTVANEKISLLI